MVVDPDVQAAREEFARWFRSQAKNRGIDDGRGAIAALHRLLKDVGRGGRKLVTQQQLRKYYRGIDYPKPDTLKKLCEQLGFQPPPANFTRMLEIKPPQHHQDPLLTHLLAAWGAITDDASRRDLVDYARWKAYGAQGGARDGRKRSSAR